LHISVLVQISFVSYRIVQFTHPKPLCESYHIILASNWKTKRFSKIKTSVNITKVGQIGVQISPKGQRSKAHSLMWVAT